ncbi:MAG: hypothetical protein IVW57_10585 [Ktedonobacterales bacterium]|nr:hypothetical protein [Ktedonobacterales bacterium]
MLQQQHTHPWPGPSDASCVLCREIQSNAMAHTTEAPSSPAGAPDALPDAADEPACSLSAENDQETWNTLLDDFLALTRQ